MLTTLVCAWPQSGSAVRRFPYFFLSPAPSLLDQAAPRNSRLIIGPRYGAWLVAENPGCPSCWRQIRTPTESRTRTIAKGEPDELSTQSASTRLFKFVLQRPVTAARNRAQLRVPTQSGIGPRLGSRDRVGAICSILGFALRLRIP